MKSFKILILSMLVTLSVCAQQKVTILDTIRTSKEPLTVREVYSDVKEGFQKLVSTLEGPAKHTYEIYVRQQIVKGLGMLVGTVLCFIVGLGLLLYNFKKCEHNDDFSFANLFSLLGFILLVVSLVLIIVFFAYKDSGFSQLLNPEYYAIREIIKAFK